MKILYLYQHFVLPEKSGITRTYEFARRLCAMGHEVHLIASDENQKDIKIAPYETLNSGIHIHWLPIPYHNRLSFFKRILAFSKYIIGALKCGRALQFDLVYVSSPPLTATLPAVFLAKTRKVPLVLEVRDLWPDLPIVFKALRDPLSKKLAKAIERFAYRKATHVIALSPGIQRAVSARGVPSKNITFIPNSCDIDSFNSQSNASIHLPPNIRSEDSIILYPGTLGVANNISYIIYLAKQIQQTHSKIKFLVVGDGKERNHIQLLATQLGVLNKSFFLLDPIPKKDIPALFQRSTLILNTLVNKKALWNSSPNKFFDALAAGKPIAINFKGWLAELIQQHDIGLVLDPTNFQKAAQQITEALSRPLWAEKAGRNAFALGNRDFNRDLLSMRLNETLIKLIPTAKNLPSDYLSKKIASKQL